MKAKQLFTALCILFCAAIGSATAQSDNRGTLVKEWREGDYIIRRRVVADNNPHTVEYDIFYAINQADMAAGYEDNSKTLNRLDNFFAELQRDTLRHIKRISITGYASPDGTTPYNSELARRRAQQLSRLINERYKLGTKYNVAVTSHVEPWSATTDAIEHSSLQNRNELVRMVNAKEAPMVIDNRLKHETAAWQYLTRDVLPDMRRTTIEITYTEDRVSDSREYSPEEPEVIIVEETVIEKPRHHRHHKVEVVNEWDGVIIDLGATSEGYGNE